MRTKYIAIGLLLALLGIGTGLAVYTIYSMTIQTTVSEAFVIGYAFGDFGDCDYVNCEGISSDVWVKVEDVTITEEMYPGEKHCLCFKVWNQCPEDIGLGITTTGTEVQATPEFSTKTIPGYDTVYFWVEKEAATDTIPGDYDVTINFNRL